MKVALVVVVLLFSPGTANAAPASATSGVARAHAIGARPELAGADLRLERTEPWGLVRFRRHHRGVPVIGGVVSVRIDDAGGLVYAAGGRGQVPAGLSVVPLVDAASAVRLASGGGLDEPRAAELRVMALPGRGARLVWDVRLPLDWEERRAWRVLVDARDGSLLGRHNLLKRAGRAKVFPGGTPFDAPLTEVTLNLPAGAQRLANADFKTSNCIDRRTCPLELNNQHWRFCEIEPKAMADANGDFLYGRPATDVEPEDEFAEVQILYHADVTMKKFRSLGLDRLGPLPIDTHVNVRFPANATCDPLANLQPFENAFYFAGMGYVYQGWPQTAALVFGQGATVDNAYEGDTIYHELTHALQERLYGDTLFPQFIADWGLSIDGGSMGEATADYFAAVITGDPRVFEYSLPLEYQRDVSVFQKCPKDITGEYHEDSVIFSSALWSARQALPEAQRETLDQALYRAMAASAETDAYDEAQRKIVAEMRALAGDAAAQIVAGKFAEHGIDGCSDYVADLAAGERWPLLFLGSFLEARVPAPVQWRLELAQPVDRLAINIDDSTEVERAVFIVAKPGREPIHWNPETRTHDGASETAILLTGTRHALVPGPFPAGPVVLQLVVVPALPFPLVLQGIRFRGENAPVVPDGGPTGAGDDGGGCAAGNGTGAGGAPWVLLLFLFATRRRRR